MCNFKIRMFATMVIAAVILAGCGGKPPTRYKQTFFRMDTISDVTLILPRGSDAGPFWRSIDSLLLDWEKRFSVTGPESEVQVLNDRNAPAMPVGPQLAEMIAFALRYGDSLCGGFDLTILPVKEVWGFGEDASDTIPLPDSASIEAALSRVAYNNVRLNARHDTVFFASPQTRIDVGGIAKGFVLHEAFDLLDSRGLSDFLVVAGGDVVAKGKRPDGNPWMVGIQHPRRSGDMIGTMTLDSGSVVTSGDYERFRIVDGKRYHHIFNSSTGQCCLANQSVTVWGMNPIEVDVLSTGLFCRPAEEIVEYINKRPRFQCLVVDSSGGTHASSGWWGEILDGN